MMVVRLEECLRVEWNVEEFKNFYLFKNFHILNCFVANLNFPNHRKPSPTQNFPICLKLPSIDDFKTFFFFFHPPSDTQTNAEPHSSDFESAQLLADSGNFSGARLSQLPEPRLEQIRRAASEALLAAAHSIVHRLR